MAPDCFSFPPVDVPVLDFLLCRADVDEAEEVIFVDVSYLRLECLPHSQVLAPTLGRCT